MRISFYSAAALAAGAGLFGAPAVEAVKIEACDPLADTWAQDYEPVMLAQTEAGAEAEAQYFKKIVHFAKDAINTIAPAISTKNKQVQGLAKPDKK